MFAQSLVEYGALAAVRDGISRLMHSMNDLVTTPSSESWLVLGAILVVVFLVWNRRSRR
jgi:hypothetical protein